jgi:hypothetical protein
MGFGAVLAHALVRKSVQDPERLLFGGTKPARQALLRTGGFFLFEGVVGGANQGAGFDVLEAHFFAEVFEFGELVGMQEAVDGKMFRRRLQVLAESKDVSALRGDVLHRSQRFFARFTETQHHSCFRGQIRRGFARATEKLERALVDGAFADLAIETRHGFHVVVQDVGLGAEYDVERGPMAAEIGDQDFDAAAGDTFADAPDGACENRGAAVGLVVAIHGSDDGVAQAHSFNGFGDALGFVFFRRTEGLTARDGAEAAGARADIAEDHEGRGAVFPALAHVGAARAFADSVKVERAHDALEFLIVGAAEEFHA